LKGIQEHVMEQYSAIFIIIAIFSEITLKFGG